MVKAKKWILEKHFQGMPKRSDMKLVEFELAPLEDGEVLLEALYLSVDPYMRPSSGFVPEGGTMMGCSATRSKFNYLLERMKLMGGQVARVIESKNSGFPVGTNVVCQPGWVTHSVSDGSDLVRIPPYPEEFPVSLALGVLGMPGMTARYGFLEICAPKPGEIVVVNGAAGAVGSVVGQLAKIVGCKVIGFAGSDEKVRWLKDLGFDEAFNYKTIKDLDATLKSVAPNGIDCYFDNVGGEFSSIVLGNMAKFGRISCCGVIASHNNTGTTPIMLPEVHRNIIFKEVKMQGFMIISEFRRWPEWTQKHIEWIQEGKLKYREHITEGFDNMFEAFLGLFTGANIGKAIVKV